MYSTNMWICLHKCKVNTNIYVNFVKKKQIVYRGDSLICCNKEEQKFKKFGRKQV